jgi:hypothetical protein
MNPVMTDLLERSLTVIMENQQPGGAFLACPFMPDYQFSWFRDGAYIAYALTMDGLKASADYNFSMAAQWESAYKFHSWCADRVNEREASLAQAVSSGLRGEKPAPQHRLTPATAPMESKDRKNGPCFSSTAPGHGSGRLRNT